MNTGLVVHNKKHADVFDVFQEFVEIFAVDLCLMDFQSGAFSSSIMPLAPNTVLSKM